MRYVNSAMDRNRQKTEQCNDTGRTVVGEIRGGDGVSGGEPPESIEA